MKFLVDAQLPRRLANWLRTAGHDTVPVHTLDLPEGNRTKDVEINATSLRTDQVVITKDADFVNSYLLTGAPRKLLLIATGNITNSGLETLFNANIQAITKAFQTHAYLELTRATLVIHH